MAICAFKVGGCIIYEKIQSVHAREVLKSIVLAVCTVDKEVIIDPQDIRTCLNIYS